MRNDCHIFLNEIHLSANGINVSFQDIHSLKNYSKGKLPQPQTHIKLAQNLIQYDKFKLKSQGCGMRGPSLILSNTNRSNKSKRTKSQRICIPTHKIPERHQKVQGINRNYSL